MKTIFAVTIALSLGTIPATSVKAQLPITQSTHTSLKKQTSDPYFSTPAQTAAEQNTTWSNPQSTPSSGQREIWKSLSRKTSKPVQRIDFSQLQVNPQVKADLLKTASAWQTPQTDDANAHVKKRENATTIDFSVPATSSPAVKPKPNQHLKQAKQVVPVKPKAVKNSKSFSSLVPLPVAKTAPRPSVAKRTRKSKPLSPLPNPNPAPKQPKKLATTPVSYTHLTLPTIYSV